LKNNFINTFFEIGMEPSRGRVGVLGALEVSIGVAVIHEVEQRHLSQVR